MALPWRPNRDDRGRRSCLAQRDRELEFVEFRITRVDSELVKRLAHDSGFELAGVAPAIPLEEAGYYHEWVTAGYAGEMGYLTDRRAGLRNDPRHLLPSAKSVICAGKLYNGPEPYSKRLNSAEL